MSNTAIRSRQIGTQEVQRTNLDVTNSSKAVVAKVAAGSGVSISSTGVDSGTGDVTISVYDISINTVNSNTTLPAVSGRKYVYIVSGTTTITLPTAIGNKSYYTIKNVGASTITISTSLGQTIDGSSSATMSSQYLSLDIISDGSNWFII